MGFIERAFTPPGTGGAEAAGIMAEAAAKQASTTAQNMAQAAPAPVAPPPAPPTMPTVAPPTPPVFQPGQSPGQKQRAQITASTMLGAAAAGGQTSKKTLLGQ
jgi:hypothetical protein